jgi:hypothetical protein
MVRSMILPTSRPESRFGRLVSLSGQSPQTRQKVTLKHSAIISKQLQRVLTIKMNKKN